MANIANIRRLLENRAGRVVIFIAKLSAIKVKAPDTFAFAIEVAAKILFLTLVGKPAIVSVRLGAFCGSSVQLDFVGNRSNRHADPFRNFS